MEPGGNLFYCFSSEICSSKFLIKMFLYSEIFVFILTAAVLTLLTGLDLMFPVGESIRTLVLLGREGELVAVTVKSGCADFTKLFFYF